MSLITNMHDLPEAFVEAVEYSDYDIDPSDLNKISVTTLVDAPRVRMLKARHSKYCVEDATSATWRMLGSACHAVAERASTASIGSIAKVLHKIICNTKEENGKLWSATIHHIEEILKAIEEHLTKSFSEKRLEYLYGGKILTGKPDRYKNSKVSDFKITSVWTKVYNPEGKNEWKYQQNIYSFLIKKSGLPVDQLEIVAIYRDWSERDTEKTGYPKFSAEGISLEIMSDDEISKYIHERMRLHIECEKLKDDELPTCTESERWAKASSYAVYKGVPEGKPVRVLSTREEAVEYMTEKGITTGTIKKREGEDIRCERYCTVNNFCNYYKEKYGSKTKESYIL